MYSILLLIIFIGGIFIIGYLSIERFTIPLHPFTDTITDKCNEHEICNSDGVCWDKNIDCINNFKYQKSMCLQKHIHNKKRLCNSIVGVEPRFQNVDNPSNFMDF